MDSRIWKVIIAVAALHVLVLGSMFLIQHGCKSKPPEIPLAQPEAAPPIPPMAPAPPPPTSVQPLPPTAYVPPSTPSAPTAPAYPPPPSAPTTKIYTIQKGDTLSKIAKTQGTTVAALKRANNLTSDFIRVGQKLKIPSPQASGQRPTPSDVDDGESTVITASGVTHIVKAGETPAEIAKQYGVTTKALLAANGNPDPRRLKIGQKLVIPLRPAEAPTTREPTEVAPLPEPMPAETPPADSETGYSGSAVAPPTDSKSSVEEPANQN